METNLTPLHQIRHSAAEILFWQEAIEKAKHEIKQNPGKEKYIESRLYAIKYWQGKIQFEERMLNDAIADQQKAA